MRAWVVSADRQLEELKDQRVQLEEAIAELQRLRDDTAQSLLKIDSPT